MTEKELVKEFWSFAYWCKPRKADEFEAYITGTGPWPKGIKYELSSFPDEVEEELGGPNDALALRILQAAALSMKGGDKVPLTKTGIRVLQSLGESFQDIYSRISGSSKDSHTYGTWHIAPTLIEYCRDEVRSYLEKNLPALSPEDKLYGINIALAAEILASESSGSSVPEQYKGFIPLIEAFVEKQIHEEENDIELTDWFIQREHQYCGHRAAFLAGDCSPVLQKLRLRILYDTWFPYCPYSGEELWELGKKIGLPDEWFELLLLQGDIEKSPAELAAHFNKLYTENRPLFEKTHRAFYWRLDGKTLDDEVPHPRKKSFRFSFYLLAIKLAAGEGQKDVAELAEHWDDLIEFEKDSYFCDNASSSPDYTRPFAAIYESGIPGLDKLFDEKFAAYRKEDDRIDYLSYIIRFIIHLREDWRSPASTVQALHTANRISVEDFHNAFNAVKWNLDTPEFTFPSAIIRDYTRLHQDETRTYLTNHLTTIGAKTVHSEQSEDFANWIKAVFMPGGQDIKDALILFGAKSKRVFRALEELLLSREDEIRPELEAKLPKFKKDASETAQRLIARWNALPGAAEKAARRTAAEVPGTIGGTGDAAPTVPGTSAWQRSFTFQDGKSNKFWTIQVTGANYTATYGRVGSSGQTTEKSFDTEAACVKEANKLIAEKTKKGYAEVSVTAVPGTVSAPSATPSVAPISDTAVPGTVSDAPLADPALDTIWAAKVNPARKKLIAWIPEEIFAAVYFADGKTPAPNGLRFVFAEHILLGSPIPLPECAEIIAALDKKSVRQALNAVYDTWLSTGADTKKKTVLIPYCFYTPVTELLAFKKQIYDWTDSSRGALAAFAAECFAANGSDLAFLAVDELAQKAGNKQVKKAARGALLNAAAQLGITLDELLDKIVPTLDFDQNGKRIFDYGPRQFEAVLQKDFSVALTDLTAGKPVKSLPAPNAKDDKEKADQAKAGLSELKKFIKAVVKSQTLRLERVLIDGRPWKLEAWKKLFVENPIMRCFASGLIWGAYDASGKLLETFRSMDDGTFNTAGDEEYTLPETALISLAHPIEMGAETTAAWKQQLEDYEIIQNVKQLEVKLVPLKDEDIETEKNFGVKHYLGNSVPEGALTGMAKKYDMERGPTGDGGSYYSYAFNDTWLGLTAAITFEGPYMGGGEPGDLQYAYFYKLPGPDTEDPMEYGEIAKGAGLDPRTLPQRFVNSMLAIFDNLLNTVEAADEQEEP